ncbi:MAG: 1,4-alpha-glucan branching protein domain-containing protein [Deltaproteobacteria bacterium]
MSSKLMLVLHSHIPYVKRQGRWPFGEVWLFEAMAETYIPLLRSLKKLREDGINVALTFSFSPTLLEQLASRYIQQEFINYLHERETLAADDERYFMSRGETEQARIAAFYHRFYRDIRRDYMIEMDMDIVECLRQMQEEGVIEILTSAATHAYLPLLDYTSLQYQVHWGKKVYEHYLRRSPEGFWLPECGYFQGIEDILIENGFKYFYVDSHAIEGGKPIEVFSGGEGDGLELETFASTGLSTYRPYRIEGKDITVYGRNAMISNQVWSADFGYPGDPDYREFHKHEMRSGFKYWKVTDRNNPMDRKLVYNPEKAVIRSQQHAHHFVRSLEENSREAIKLGFATPLIVGCYDTELFGHWWWEGVSWLEEVIRELHQSTQLEMITPKNAGPAQHEAQVFESSWGMGGKHYMWNNAETGWMWEIIKKVGQEYETLKSLSYDSKVSRRAVTQALKELMLIQSSDWLFMVSNNLTRDYAMKRFFDHYTKLLRLSDSLTIGQLNEEFESWLGRVEYEDDFLNLRDRSRDGSV